MSQAPKVLLAHPGTQYSYRLAMELHRRNLLSAFVTGLAFSAQGKLGRTWEALPSPARRLLANRRIENIPKEKLSCQPAPELVALLKLRVGADSQRVLYRRNAAFQRHIAKHLLASANIVVGFDTSSWILAKRARDLQIPFLLDQSIAHPDSKTAVFNEVRSQFPDWSEDVGDRLPAVRRAEQEEHDGANLIIAASSFTQRTLIEHGVDAEKIRVNPYGVDCASFSCARTKQVRPFRFIFVGAISARKGVPLLLEAWRQMNTRDAELWLAGPTSRRIASLLPDLAGLRYFGALPHVELPHILQQCDVLVFPSYFEGFGLVILEAMACGLPVIATTATAAPDIYDDGNEGWIIAPGDLTRLIDSMSECLENHVAVGEKGVAARGIAERFSWTAYGDRWAEILKTIGAD